MTNRSPGSRVAVMGATGFLGRHVVPQLAGDGFTVMALGRREYESSVGVESRSLDVLHAKPEDLDSALKGCSAIVNLVGIKRECGKQTFAGVHVDVVERLIAAALRTGTRRFVHISVVVSREDRRFAYHDTKWRAERLIEQSGLDWTILKPGVIYGRGDDMLSHLTQMIRAAPVFPVVGEGTSLMQPVAVEDVALAVSRCLQRPETTGRSYDLVGPDRLELREIVRRVAAALELPLRIIPTPVGLMRPAVRAMGWFMAQPLSTPSQLQMLVEGMTGNTGPAERDLGLAPRPFEISRIRDVVRECPQRLPLTLRLGESDRTPQHWVEIKVLGLAAVAITGWLVVFSQTGGDVWVRVVTMIGLLGLLAIPFVQKRGAGLFRIDRLSVYLGLGTAGVMYVVAACLMRVPFLTERAQSLLAWRGDHGAPFLAVTIIGAAIAEELFWRGAIQGLISGTDSRGVAVLGSALICAGVHFATGTWLIPLAALLAGATWGLLYAVTGRLSALIISHATWDLLILVVAPIG